MGIRFTLALLLYTFLIPALLTGAESFASGPHTRLDPALRMLASTPQVQRAAFKDHFKVMERDRLGVILEYTGDPASLCDAGVSIRSRLGSILTAVVPARKLEAIAALPGIRYVQAARRLHPMLDVSAPETRASNLRSGTPPDWVGYTGQGVVIGVIDSGIDLNHADFRDVSNQTRVLFLWDQTTGTGGANHPPPYDYGTEWTKAQIDAGQCTETDPGGHGTGVTAIAAGDGSATGNGWPAYRYVGMAPQADIVFVKSTFSSDDIVDGMDYIKSRADSLGKPFVINLSLGTEMGAHDGTDLLELAIDQISGPGAVVCTASGNSGTTDPTRYIHAELIVPSHNSTATADISVLSNRANPFYLDIWYEGEDSIDMTVTSPNGYSVTKATGQTTGGYVSTPDGNIWVENSPGGTNPYNDDHECIVAVQNALAGTWHLTATGQTIDAGGHCDAWAESNQNVFWATLGNNSMSLTIPGTSNSVITVGGYLTKSWWYNPDGTLQGWPSTYGAFVVSSGEGLTRDGRQKPDLAVPTTRIATARSSTYSPNPINIVEDGVHVVMSGTSMAVPHMTGAVALALQKDPTATASEIKSFVISTARSDSLTGTVPNTRWGYGKLDIEAAMTLIPLYTGVSGARAQSTDTLVKLAGQVVSAGLDQLGDRFYVEPPDRSSGIQIRRASGDQPVETDVVTVVGTTGLIGGEAGILNSTITRTGTGGDVPNPVMLINRSLGGRSAGSWIPGVTGGTGLNNIGLLARTAGRVTYIGGDHFYIDDGTNLVGNGQIGVQVYCPGLTKPLPTELYAVVTGISSLELAGATTYPVLRPRKQSDLVYY